MSQRHWIFGDGSTYNSALSLSHRGHTYESPGTYVALVEDRDDEGTVTAVYVTVLKVQGGGSGLSQTIDFPQPPDTARNDGPVKVTATATSELPVSFSSETPAVCTVGPSTEVEGYVTVYDDFNRGSTTAGLGVATNGRPWTQTGMGLQVAGQHVSGTADNDAALLDIATAAQDFKIKVSGTTGYFQLYFKAVDLNNCYVVNHDVATGRAQVGLVHAGTMTWFDRLTKTVPVSASSVWHVRMSESEIHIDRDGVEVWTFDVLGSGDPPPPPSPVTSLVAFAWTFLGKPYDEREWLLPQGTPGVGIGPDAYTCDGLMIVVFGHFGITLPYTPPTQHDALSPVAAGQRRAGDLAFFHWNVEGNPRAWNHVALLADSAGSLINANSDKTDAGHPNGQVCTNTVAEFLAKTPGSVVEYRRTTLA